jgi:hypothetical protein
MLQYSILYKDNTLSPFIHQNYHWKHYIVPNVICHSTFYDLVLPSQHDSCPLGSLLSKLRITWIQALQYCDSHSNNQDSCQVNNGQETCTVWIH